MSTKVHCIPKKGLNIAVFKLNSTGKNKKNNAFPNKENMSCVAEALCQCDVSVKCKLLYWSFPSCSLIKRTKHFHYRPKNKCSKKFTKL